MSSFNVKVKHIVGERTVELIFYLGVLSCRTVLTRMKLRVSSIDGVTFAKEVFTLEDWKDAVKEDDVLQNLIQVICKGWPREATVPDCLKQFSKITEEICCEDGLGLRGSLLIQPQKLKNRLVDFAHL